MSVFANGLGVSSKATDSKTIAAMPDVCLSPPPPPAGPVPLPYPMTGMATDTTDGCTSVMVEGKEAGKKNSTKYSKTMGNEPATNSFGANILTHKLSSSLKFAAYSFDVIFEGGGACRFTDLTTQNHMNTGGGSASVNIRKPAPKPPRPSAECATLKSQNTAFREKYGRKIIKTRKSTGKGVQFNTSGTVSHANFRSAGGGGGASFTGVSATKELVKAGVPGLCAPVNAKKKPRPKTRNKPRQNKGNFTNKKKTRIKMDFCDGACVHDVGLEAHAELNILNCIGRRGPTTKKDSVTFGIDWNGAEGKGSPNPCPNCQKMIKCACQCMTIYVCNKKGQKIDRCKEPFKK